MNSWESACEACVSTRRRCRFHTPASISHGRSVSLLTRSRCFSARYSAASASIRCCCASSRPLGRSFIRSHSKTLWPIGDAAGDCAWMTAYSEAIRLVV